MALTAVCKPTHWRFLQHSKRPFTTTQQSWGRWRPAPLQQQGAAARLAVTKSSLFTEAWGTNSPEELQTLATTVSSNLFAFSIIPYAGFLYYLTKSKAAPPLMLFGWYFLLAFVAVSIPAGIYAFASQALLTALSSAQFVSNVVFAWWLHGEPVKLRVLLATAIIIAGNIVLVAFASKTDPKYTALDLRHFYLSDQYTYYLTAAWGGGLVGAQAVIFSTSLSILGKETLAGNNQLNTWFTAVLVGLRWFDASVIIPLLQIIYVMLNMVSGNLYFQEFNRFSQLQLIMFLVGTGLLLLGIYCLTPSVQGKGDSHAEVLEEQDTVGDATVAARLLGEGAGKSSPAVAGPRHQQPAPPLCLLPGLGQLDIQALMRLPHKQMLAVLHQLELVPRTEEEARLLERVLANIAWQQQRQQARGGATAQQLNAALQLQRGTVAKAAQQGVPVQPAWGGIQVAVEVQRKAAAMPPQAQELLAPSLLPRQEHNGDIAMPWLGQQQAAGSCQPQRQPSGTIQPPPLQSPPPQLLRMPNSAEEAATAWSLPAVHQQLNSSTSPAMLSNPLFEEQTSPGAVVVQLPHLAASAAALPSSTRSPPQAAPAAPATAGDGDQLKAASVFSMPMLMPTTRHLLPPGRTLAQIRVQQQQQQLQALRD
ncbi:hypothetical protein N2152v2_006105 [Parachlorella kessleri]